MSFSNPLLALIADLETQKKVSAPPSTAGNTPRSSDSVATAEEETSVASDERRASPVCAYCAGKHASKRCDLASYNDTKKACRRCGSFLHPTRDCGHSCCKYCKGVDSKCHRKLKCFCLSLHSHRQTWSDEDEKERVVYSHSPRDCPHRVCRWCGANGRKAHYEDDCGERGCQWCSTKKSELNHEEKRCAKRPCRFCGLVQPKHGTDSKCPKRRCFYCRMVRPDHRDADCPRRLENVQCYRCLQYGHISAHCDA